MSFNDIFKSSFLENVSEFSVLDTVLGLAVSLVIGLFIFLIYKKTLTGVMYSSGFALTLVGLSLVTTLVIMAVTSNVVLSLGMVDAIKEPVEIVFLFWSLAVGIVVGAGLLPLAVIGSAIIGVILLLFANRKVRNDPYILVLNCTDETAEHAALDVLKENTEHPIVKSKSITTAGIELTAELRGKNASTDFVNTIAHLPGVGSATLVSYNGEYLS